MKTAARHRELASALDAGVQCLGKMDDNIRLDRFQVHCKWDRSASVWELVSRRDSFIIPPTAVVKTRQFYGNAGGLGWRAASFDLASLRLDIRDWHYYAGVHDPTTAGQEIRLYVDGGPWSTASTSGMITNSTQPLYIGFDNASVRWCDGLIDELAVYDHALNYIWLHFPMTIQAVNG